MSDLDRLMAAAICLVDLAADIVADAWRNDIAVDYKPDGSSVTPADLLIEERWRSEIRRQFPSHGILGEEYGPQAGTSAFTWVLDPIDGTRQFGAGLLDYASLIAVCRDGVPVLGIIDTPVPHARYAAAAGQGALFAGRAIRSSIRTDMTGAVISLANPNSFSDETAFGYEALRSTGRVRVHDGGALAYGALARGRVDVCINGDDLDAYDICALCPVVQEAGGVITDWRGESLSLASRGGIVASASPELHAKVLERLQGSL
ncbi:inositol monophosphatase family protein [Paracoccus tibetensis]|uniref:Histidinol-phosphatase, inositol monophosphatase family n=1 Tax=Paracoccus tibetensis TaxID=336292 RepID=A0A1G5G4T7_9RHOB|nr:inositol monophosphatase family protein [Paracoccus tibetensis]SCY46563.1 histidinol-phosphatase, inositol monophosphatase family [Paracoccus tibetensis]